MTPTSTTHLSEEALDDVLIGLGTAESLAHLAACPECRAQVATFRGDMAFLNAASMAWSESRRPQPRAPEAHGGRVRAAFLGWAVAAAALVLMAVGLWHYRPEAAPHQANMGQQSQPADSEAQIAQDNQLLQAVNAAISPNEMSPLDEYKILESPHPYTKARSKMRKK
jgi:anti-sigma factor RsiW